jgi:XTP/dITP diphosphohydrolase
VREVVLATRSPGKVRELRPLFEAAGWVVLTLEDVGVAESPAEDAIEAFDSFEANARAKVRYFAPLVGGRPVVAEDSGLCVNALGGAPGVRSRRWSGRHDLGGAALDDANNKMLADSLRGVAPGRRAARYECVAVWRCGDVEEVERGECTGMILEAPSAGAGGFGYDPWFWSRELGRSFADASQEEKARVSHRGRAVARLLRVIAGR